MSTSTIRSAVVTILDAVSGVSNVYEEEPSTFNEVTEDRIDGARVHFWLVDIEDEPPLMGIGYVEQQRRVRVQGWIGVSRDDPEDGTNSDQTAATLLSAVVAKFADATNRTLTSTVLDSWDYTPEPITTVARRIGDETHLCHRIGFNFLTAEDA